MADRTEVKGYIVLIDPGTPAVESTGDDREGVLYRHGYRRAATVFPSRGIAQRRIDRTVAFSDENGFGWRASEYNIVPVRGTAEPVS